MEHIHGKWYPTGAPNMRICANAYRVEGLDFKGSGYVQVLGAKNLPTPTKLFA